MTDSFGARSTLAVDGNDLEIFRLDALEKRGVGKISRLPLSLKVLLENLLRHEDGASVRAEDIEALPDLHQLWMRIVDPGDEESVARFIVELQVSEYIFGFLFIDTADCHSRLRVENAGQPQQARHRQMLR